MVTAAAADPYNSPDDVAAYQAYTGQGQYGQPMPPPGQYPAPNYAQRNQLEAQLNYAEAQYNRAQQAGDWAAAKHWKKQIKHLRRELSAAVARKAQAMAPVTERQVTCRLRSRPMRRQASAYAPPMQEYPPSGCRRTRQPYPPVGYPPTGYPNAGPAYQYGAPGAPGQAGSTGGLSSLLGPLFGGGGAPSAAPAIRRPDIQTRQPARPTALPAVLDRRARWAVWDHCSVRCLADDRLPEQARLI